MQFGSISRFRGAFAISTDSVLSDSKNGFKTAGTTCCICLNAHSARSKRDFLVLRFNGTVVQCSVPGHAETKVPVKLAFLSRNSGTHDRSLLGWILMAQENRDKFLLAEHFVKPYRYNGSLFNLRIHFRRKARDEQRSAYLFG